MTTFVEQLPETSRKQTEQNWSKHVANLDTVGIRRTVKAAAILTLSRTTGRGIRPLKPKALKGWATSFFSTDPPFWVEHAIQKKATRVGGWCLQTLRRAGRLPRTFQVFKPVSHSLLSHSLLSHSLPRFNAAVEGAGNILPSKSLASAVVKSMSG